MDKKELLEMVNATISENGKREITGKALNLALTQIIEAMGESGGGAGGVTIYCNGGNESDEQKAHNAVVWAQLKAMVEAKQSLPPIMVDLTEAMLASQGIPTDGVSVVTPAFLSMLDTTGVTSTVGAKGLILAINVPQELQFVVFEDGSISTEVPASAMSL